MAYDDAFKKFPVLTTKRLLLDALVPEDACALQQQMQGIPPYSMWPAPFVKEKQARMRIGHHANAYKKKSNIHWAIRIKKSKKLIGLCKLFELEYAFRAKIGYWITKRVLERIGYQQEGTLRDHVIYDGVFQDMLLYAIVKKPDEAGKWLHKPWASR